MGKLPNLRFRISINREEYPRIAYNITARLSQQAIQMLTRLNELKVVQLTTVR